MTENAIFNKKKYIVFNFFSSEESPGLANLLDDNVEWMEELIRWVFLDVQFPRHSWAYPHNLQSFQRKQ